MPRSSRFLRPLAAEDIGSRTPIVPGGGLAAHESGAINAHTLAKHVSKLDAELVERANTPVTQKNGKQRPPPSSVSSFYDRPTAERAATRVLEARALGR